MKSSLKIRLRKLFALPGPKELGWAESDALGCRLFQKPWDPPQKTWDDWREHVQKEHPIKYFFSETLFDWYWGGFPGTAHRGIKDSWYWLKCHTTKKHRHHFLDLRNVDKLEPYAWGYLEPADKIWYAVWSNFVTFVEKNKPTEWTEEDVEADPILADNRARYLEYMALYDWWTKGRFDEHAAEEAAFDATRVAKKAGNREEYERLSRIWRDLHIATESNKQEMFMRVCALREYMWT